MDDARREPAEQEGRGLSSRVGVPHTTGSRSRDCEAPWRETGHPEAGQGGSQQLAEPLGRAHPVPSLTAGERSFQRGNQAASPLLGVCH